MNWHFDVSSDEYGMETFGPYDTETEAQQGMDNVRASAAALNDEIERRFAGPYEAQG